jgi:hypothetical protein
VSRDSARPLATVALAAVASLAAFAAPGSLATATPTLAQGATVTVRVESAGAAAPLFAGSVSTLPHPVDGGDGSGAHPCSGPAGSPAPSATGALDDAMRGAGIAWHGNWDPSFRDFFIDRIGLYVSTPPDSYWSLSVDGRFSSGGCLASVSDGDTVRFYFGPLFGSPPPEDAGPPGIQGAPPAPAEPEDHSAGAGPSRPRRIGTAAARFLRRANGAGSEWAKLVLAVRRDRDAEGAAAALLGTRLGERLPGGSIDGDVNATAITVLALCRARPQAARAAAGWLARAQSGDGGFGYRKGAPADVDTSGLAAWALALEGRGGAARRAGSFIAASQNPDGGFPSLPGGSSNAQSTGLALVGLRVSAIGPRTTAAGGPGRTPLDYLASLAGRDGSIAYSAGGASPTPVWSTAQALLGLTRRGKLLLKYAPGTRLHGGNDLDRAALGWRDHQSRQQLPGFRRAGPGARGPLARPPQGGRGEGER